MTDKIIIDWVDVSECKHYKIETCLADYLFTDMAFDEAKCELNPDCYYKPTQTHTKRITRNQNPCNNRLYPKQKTISPKL